MQIFIDAKKRPDLYFWNKPIPEEVLKKWLSERNLRIPDDLIELYTKTGGGDFLESETILNPLHEDNNENLKYMNDYYWKIGMPKNWLLFHIGFGDSAINMDTLEIIVFYKKPIRIIETFKSFTEWYLLWIRDEFKDRYGL